MDFNAIFAVAVFLIVIALVMSEKVHRSLVAIGGAAVLLLAHVMTLDQAVAHVDFNTIGVLFGMMLFVAVVKQSGMFGYLAIKTAHIAKGDSVAHHDYVCAAHRPAFGIPRQRHHGAAHRPP